MSLKPLMQSLFTFGMVGGLATLTHVAVGLGLTGAGWMEPFQANFVAFLLAWCVSYFGHHRYTFQSGAGHARAMPRFLATAIVGLALNQAIVYAVVDRLGWSYPVALVLIVAVVPAIIYLISRFWAFREADA